MIKELEQISNKYKKIAEYAINLKQENHILGIQIENLQQQLTLLIEDKLRLEHKNNILSLNLNQTKDGLKILLDEIYTDELQHQSEAQHLDNKRSKENIDENNTQNDFVEIEFPPLFALQQEDNAENSILTQIYDKNNINTQENDNLEKHN